MGLENFRTDNGFCKQNCNSRVSSRFCNIRAHKKTNLCFDWNIIESVHNCSTCWCIASPAKQKWLIFKHSSMMMHTISQDSYLRLVLKRCTLEITINVPNKKVSIFTQGEIHFMAVSKTPLNHSSLLMLLCTEFITHGPGSKKKKKEKLGIYCDWYNAVNHWLNRSM